MDDQRKIKHIARMFIFSKSFLKREDIYNSVQIQDPPAKREFLMDSASKLLQETFGLSITDSSKIQSSPVASSEASILSESANSSASRKAMMQRNLHNSSNKRYMLVNSLKNRHILHTSKTSTHPTAYIKEAHKVLLLSVVFLSSFSVSLSSLSESLAVLGISKIEESFLEELVRGKYLVLTKFENELGNPDSLVEWGTRAFLEYPEESIMKITEQFCQRE